MSFKDTNEQIIKNTTLTEVDKEVLQYFSGLEKKEVQEVVAKYPLGLPKGEEKGNPDQNNQLEIVKKCLLIIDQNDNISKIKFNEEEEVVFLNWLYGTYVSLVDEFLKSGKVGNTKEVFERNRKIINLGAYVFDNASNILLSNSENFTSVLFAKLQGKYQELVGKFEKNENSVSEDEIKTVGYYLYYKDTKKFEFTTDDLTFDNEKIKEVLRKTIEDRRFVGSYVDEFNKKVNKQTPKELLKNLGVDVKTKPNRENITKDIKKPEDVEKITKDNVDMYCEIKTGGKEDINSQLKKESAVLVFKNLISMYLYLFPEYKNNLGKLLTGKTIAQMDSEINSYNETMKRYTTFNSNKEGFERGSLNIELASGEGSDEANKKLLEGFKMFLSINYFSDNADLNGNKLKNIYKKWKKGSPLDKFLIGIKGKDLVGPATKEEDMVYKNIFEFYALAKLEDAIEDPVHGEGKGMPFSPNGQGKFNKILKDSESKYLDDTFNDFELSPYFNSDIGKIIKYNTQLFKDKESKSFQYLSSIEYMSYNQIVHDENEKLQKKIKEINEEDKKLQKQMKDNIKKEADAGRRPVTGYNTIPIDLVWYAEHGKGLLVSKLEKAVRDNIKKMDEEYVKAMIKIPKPLRRFAESEYTKNLSKEEKSELKSRNIFISPFSGLKLNFNKDSVENIIRDSWTDQFTDGIFQTLYDINNNREKFVGDMTGMLGGLVASGVVGLYTGNPLLMQGAFTLGMRLGNGLARFEYRGIASIGEFIGSGFDFGVLGEGITDTGESFLKGVGALDEKGKYIGTSEFVLGLISDYGTNLATVGLGSMTGNMIHSLEGLAGKGLKRMGVDITKGVGKTLEGFGGRAMNFIADEMILEPFLIDAPANSIQAGMFSYLGLGEYDIVGRAGKGGKEVKKTGETSTRGDFFAAFNTTISNFENNFNPENLGQMTTQTMIMGGLIEGVGGRMNNSVLQMVAPAEYKILRMGVEMTVPEIRVMQRLSNENGIKQNKEGKLVDNTGAVIENGHPLFSQFVQAQTNFILAYKNFDEAMKKEKVKLKEIAKDPGSKEFKLVLLYSKYKGSNMHMAIHLELMEKDLENKVKIEKDKKKKARYQKILDEVSEDKKMLDDFRISDVLSDPDITSISTSIENATEPEKLEHTSNGKITDEAIKGNEQVLITALTTEFETIRKSNHDAKIPDLTKPENASLVEGVKEAHKIGGPYTEEVAQEVYKNLKNKFESDKNNEGKAFELFETFFIKENGSFFEKGKDGKKACVNNYTYEQLLRKSRILKKAGRDKYDKECWKLLLREGYCGFFEDIVNNGVAIKDLLGQVIDLMIQDTDLVFAKLISVFGSPIFEKMLASESYIINDQPVTLNDVIYSFLDEFIYIKTGGSISEPIFAFVNGLKGVGSMGIFKKSFESGFNKLSAQEKINFERKLSELKIKYKENLKSEYQKRSDSNLWTNTNSAQRASEGWDFVTNSGFKRSYGFDNFRNSLPEIAQEKDFNKKYEKVISLLSQLDAQHNTRIPVEKLAILAKELIMRGFTGQVDNYGTVKFSLEPGSNEYNLNVVVPIISETQRAEMGVDDLVETFGLVVNQYDRETIKNAIIQASRTEGTVVEKSKIIVDYLVKTSSGGILISESEAGRIASFLVRGLYISSLSQEQPVSGLSTTRTELTPSDIDKAIKNGALSDAGKYDVAVQNYLKQSGRKDIWIEGFPLEKKHVKETINKMHQIGGPYNLEIAKEIYDKLKNDFESIAVNKGKIFGTFDEVMLKNEKGEYRELGYDNVTPAEIGNYTTDQLKIKYQIGRDGGFTDSFIQFLLREGYCGDGDTRKNEIEISNSATSEGYNFRKEFQKFLSTKKEGVKKEILDDYGNPGLVEFLESFNIYKSSLVSNFSGFLNEEIGDYGERLQELEKYYENLNSFISSYNLQSENYLKNKGKNLEVDELNNDGPFMVKTNIGFDICMHPEIAKLYIDYINSIMKPNIESKIELLKGQDFSSYKSKEYLVDRITLDKIKEGTIIVDKSGNELTIQKIEKGEITFNNGEKKKKYEVLDMIKNGDCKIQEVEVWPYRLLNVTNSAEILDIIESEYHITLPVEVRDNYKKSSEYYREQLKSKTKEQIYQEEIENTVSLYQDIEKYFKEFEKSGEHKLYQLTPQKVISDNLSKLLLLPSKLQLVYIEGVCKYLNDCENVKNIVESIKSPKEFLCNSRGLDISKINNFPDNLITVRLDGPVIVFEISPNATNKEGVNELYEFFYKGIFNSSGTDGFASEINLAEFNGIKINVINGNKESILIHEKKHSDNEYTFREYILGGSKNYKNKEFIEELNFNTLPIDLAKDEIIAYLTGGDDYQRTLDVLTQDKLLYDYYWRKYKEDITFYKRILNKIEEEYLLVPEIEREGKRTEYMFFLDNYNKSNFKYELLRKEHKQEVKKLIGIIENLEKQAISYPEIGLNKQKIIDIFTLYPSYKWEYIADIYNKKFEQLEIQEKESKDYINNMLENGKLKIETIGSINQKNLIQNIDLNNINSENINNVDLLDKGYWVDEKGTLYINADKIPDNIQNSILLLRGYKVFIEADYRLWKDYVDGLLEKENVEDNIQENKTEISDGIKNFENLETSLQLLETTANKKLITESEAEQVTIKLEETVERLKTEKIEKEKSESIFLKVTSVINKIYNKVSDRIKSRLDKLRADIENKRSQAIEDSKLSNSNLEFKKDSYKSRNNAEVTLEAVKEGFSKNYDFLHDVVIKSAQELLISVDDLVCEKTNFHLTNDHFPTLKSDLDIALNSKKIIENPELMIRIVEKLLQAQSEGKIEGLKLFDKTNVFEDHSQRPELDREKQKDLILNLANAGNLKIGYDFYGDGNIGIDNEIFPEAGNIKYDTFGKEKSPDIVWTTRSGSKNSFPKMGANSYLDYTFTLMFQEGLNIQQGYTEKMKFEKRVEDFLNQPISSRNILIEYITSKLPNFMQKIGAKALGSKTEFDAKINILDQEINKTVDENEKNTLNLCKGIIVGAYERRSYMLSGGKELPRLKMFMDMTNTVKREIVDLEIAIANGTIEKSESDLKYYAILGKVAELEGYDYSNINNFGFFVGLDIIKSIYMKGLEKMRGEKYIYVNSSEEISGKDNSYTFESVQETRKSMVDKFNNLYPEGNNPFEKAVNIVELSQIYEKMKTEGLVVGQSDGTMKCFAKPGVESKLDLYNFLQVRSEAFKINYKGPLDENGEPQLFYHGTASGGFNEFDIDKIGSNSSSKQLGSGFYFGKSKEEVEKHMMWTDNKQYEIKVCFLNVSKIFSGFDIIRGGNLYFSKAIFRTKNIFNSQDFSTILNKYNNSIKNKVLSPWLGRVGEEVYNGITDETIECKTELEYKQEQQKLFLFQMIYQEELKNYLIENGYDASSGSNGIRTNEIMVLNPNQIFSADPSNPNIGTFSNKNPDITR